MKIRVIAGRIVQINSIVCPSNRNRWVSLLKNRPANNCPTRIVIIIKIRRVWSWKKASCSMRGDALSCRSSSFQVAISKKSENFMYGV